MNVGLTGGMGCGKSTVLSMYKEQGFQVLESDDIVRNLLSHDTDVIRAVSSRFGPAVLAEGRVDRRSLAANVFGNEDNLRWLEELLHPRVRNAWQGAIAGGCGSNWVVEIPLLFEKSLENLFDMTVCVSASLNVQLERLAQRGFSAEQALARMARQLPLGEKERRASYVISNNGSVDFTRAQVAHITSLPNI